MSRWATWPRAWTPASVRPATVRRTGSVDRSIVVSASVSAPSTVRRPGCAAHPEKCVPSYDRSTRIRSVTATA